MSRMSCAVSKKSPGRFSGRGQLAWDSIGFDRNDFIRLHGFRLFWQQEAQHAFAEARFDLIGLVAFGKIENPLEGAIVTLVKVVAFAFFFFVFFLFPFDNQAAIGQFDLNVFLIHSGQFGSVFEALVFFGNVSSRQAVTDEFPPPERIYIKQATAKG